MRMRHFLIGAALGAALLAILPATAGADGGTDARSGSVRDQGTSSAAVGAQDDPRGNAGTSSALLNRAQAVGPAAAARGRSDVGAPTSRKGGAQTSHARKELRKYLRVSTHKPACHPRGKPPRKFTSVGFSTDSGGGDRGKHDEHDHDDHHHHGPPFCPSRH